METLSIKSIYQSKSARLALLGLTALVGAASPAFGQGTVAGKFTLTESTHLGSKILPVGTYKFSIATVGPVQTVNSIQSAQQAVLVIVRPEKGAGPVTGIFAVAFRSNRPLNSSELILEQMGDGMAMQSMYLEQPELEISFDSRGTKHQNPMLAEAVRPGPAPTSKATD
ncbi:MAG TPA: hypothetical protein VMI32_20705 [Candidatus Solibacter sp.]|nr:hypothetical protein [Candidatus Solibacter sp.]